MAPAPPLRRDAPEEELPSYVPSLIAGGVGVAALAVGSVFGIRAIAKMDESDEHCPPVAGCDETGSEASIEAGTAADVSTVSFVVAGVAAGVSAVLLIRAAGARSNAPSASVGLGVGRVAVTGVW